MNPPAPFESWFEVDVALEILRKGFTVLAQHEVAGKRIDLVVEGGQARLAVECDGDYWHGADRYEADMQRQRQLERCGWEFFRVREAAFYSNKENALVGLWQALEERGIHSRSKTEGAASQTPFTADESADVPQGGNEKDRTEEGKPVQHDEDTNQSFVVRVGSTVVYVNEDDGRECQAQITSERSNPEWGTINANTPIAKALLGAHEGDIVTAYLPVGPVRLRIVQVRPGRPL